MRHKLFTITFCFLLIIQSIQSFGTVMVNAAPVMNGDMTIEEGARPYIATADDEELIKEKNEEMLRTMQMRSDPDNVYYILNVTAFEQENGYYCGPATVKQVIHFLNGSSLTQAMYASELGTTTAGTDMMRIPDVLNQYVGLSREYVCDEIETQGDWTNQIIYNASVGLPVILDIDTTGISAFPYTTTGHFVNTSGVDIRVLSSGATNKVRITDPYTPGLGNRWYNTSTLYTANNNHWRHSFIY